MGQAGNTSTAGRARGTATGTRRVHFPAGGPVGPFLIRQAVDRLGHLLAGEREQGRFALWSPVLFLSGIAVYFSLPAEPWGPGLGVVALALLAVRMLRARRGCDTVVLTGATVFAAGIWAASLETGRVAAPQLDRTVTGRVVATVERIEPAAAGRLRLTLRPETIAGVDRERLPRRIRISARKPPAGLAAGDRVALLARLSPPPGPVMPGGYDFAFTAFYQGRGAGGFALGAVERLDPPVSGHGLSLAEAVEHIRAGLGRRIEGALDGARAAIARALILGERQAIPDRAVEDLRIAGLAHILAISGLHMVLLTASVFWTVRAMLALSPRLALDRPIKKWASATAVLAAFGYLVLSGASVATQRAFVMVAVALLAILVDRPALTLRSLMVAAFAVAALHPHAVMGPSFQMSFLAVTALVGVSEAVARRAGTAPGISRQGGTWSGRLRAVRLYAGGLAATSLIAGAATGPLAAYHFHAVAPLGLLGNLAAMPIVAFVVMPAGFVACLLIPLGLDGPFFAVMGWGIDQVLAVAAAIARLSGGAALVGVISPLTPLLAAAGILWLAIWQQRWRWAGAGLYLAAVAVVPAGERPDLLVGEAAEAVLVRNGEDIALLHPRGARFQTRIWLRALGDGRAPNDPDLRDAVRCDSLGCAATGAPVGRSGQGLVVALAREPAALLADCREADILVSRFPVPGHCPRPALVFDRNRLARTGAVALYRRPDGGWRIETARRAGDRPWQRSGAAD